MRTASTPAPIDPTLTASNRPQPTRVRVGCAGWSLPAAERARFGGGASVLAAYATRFDAVEVNSSFYRPHRRSTWQRWADSVPPGFRFSAKLPRAITHEARLQAVGPLLDEFVGQVEGLGDRLGALLVQLPPSLRFDAAVAARFFAMLGRRSAAAVVCEPRHRSWFGEQAQDLLQRHRVQRAGVDPAVPLPAATIPSADGALRYWRWHGSPRIYYSAYGEDRLAAMAAAVRAEAVAGTETWCVFDNTAAGHAVPDALHFQQSCASPPTPPRSARPR
ncbi:DUF72 domain-containing protein [Lysobacter enzymogenes]|nr:DUF72 domain-containing protein [Lysobacter enzymogenes]